MMQCKDIDDLMVDFLYQELDGERLEAWNNHVAGCARCSAEIQSLQRTRQALRALPEMEPSAAVSTRLLHEAGKRAAKATAAEGGGFFDWLHRLVGPVMAHPAWAAAASLLIVVGVAGFLSMRGKVSERAAVDQAAPAAAETSAIRDLKADRPVLSPAASPPIAPDTAVDTEKPGPGKEKKADVRAPGSPPPSYEPKVPPPAVVAAPAKGARDLSGPADEDRTARTVTSSEDKALKKAAPKPAKPFNEDLKAGRADDFGGAPAGAPPPLAEPAAPSRKERAEGNALDDGRIAPADELRRNGSELSAREKSAAGKLDAGKDAPAAAASGGKAAPPPAAPSPSAGPAAHFEKEAQTRQAPEPAPAEASPTTPPRQVQSKPPTTSKSAAAPAAQKPADSPSPPPPRPAPSAAPSAGYASGEEALSDAQVQQEATKTKAKAPAPKEPPEAELLKLSQKQASAGQCDEALGTRQRIQRMNPEFYRKRVAGDATFKMCETQNRKRSTAAPQPQRKQQDNLENDKAVEAAH